MTCNWGIFVWTFLATNVFIEQNPEERVSLKGALLKNMQAVSGATSILDTISLLVRASKFTACYSQRLRNKFIYASRQTFNVISRKNHIEKACTLSKSEQSSTTLWTDIICYILFRCQFRPFGLGLKSVNCLQIRSIVMLPNMTSDKTAKLSNLLVFIQLNRFVCKNQNFFRKQMGKGVTWKKRLRYLRSQRLFESLKNIFQKKLCRLSSPWLGIACLINVSSVRRSTMFPFNIILGE